MSPEEKEAYRSALHQEFIDADREEAWQELNRALVPWVAIADNGIFPLKGRDEVDVPTYQAAILQLWDTSPPLKRIDFVSLSDPDNDASWLIMREDQPTQLGARIWGSINPSILSMFLPGRDDGKFLPKHNAALVMSKCRFRPENFLCYLEIWLLDDVVRAVSRTLVLNDRKWDSYEDSARYSDTLLQLLCVTIKKGVTLPFHFLTEQFLRGDVNEARKMLTFIQAQMGVIALGWKADEGGVFVSLCA